MRVTFLLFDGFSNMVLSCLLEPLRAVRDGGRADLEWQILTAGDGPVRSSSGLMVAPDPRQTGMIDLLVVVAGYGHRAHAQGPARRHVADLARHSRQIVGADTGPWILAAAGLLDDREATLHWSLLPEFAEAFPHVRVMSVGHVTTDRVWTCGGASDALALMLSLIGTRFGKADAFLASTMFLRDDPRPQGDVPDRLADLVRAGSARLRPILDHMCETIDDPAPLSRLADLGGMSPSKMDRLFRADLGMSPGQFYQMLRLARAQDLARTTQLSLHDIALRCGYCDAPALSKAFRRRFGYPIGQLRQRCCEYVEQATVTEAKRKSVDPKPAFCNVSSL
ncbi:helix-turn-helix domain-containing protein [Paracoccus liaowanqingii]|uniref:Helix-turn-helix domain-containing protein n=1 Tax=Paracoccus liaowanqingii TaxID=2560053 RepID=A0A4P7HJI7_9RHOB|nr:helix-turn-helix domain-containing protein [Paracoccus liaowanqingii]QBX34284.1 helix-turn-helix domain-containing protein [Paracoccus liaowanqingii]